MPPAWVKLQGAALPPINGRAEMGRSQSLIRRRVCSKLFPLFPIEAWCQSSLYKPMVAAGLKELDMDGGTLMPLVA
jgi:hypothetical protein